MKKLKLIYNPFSGDRSFKGGLDGYIAAFQRAGYETHLFRSINPGDIEAHIGAMPRDFYDALAVAGGDGSFNIVLNALMNHDHNMPLLIIPAGTANDFAGFIKMPKGPEESAAALATGEILWADIGQANEQYFINVCAAGLFTHASHHVEASLKPTLGKLAYYIKSLEEIPSFEPIGLRITNSHTTFDEEVFLFLTLNSAGTGGFDRLAPAASISDGLFDFIAFRACPIFELGKLFIKVLKQDYLSDPNVLYFRDNYIKAELSSESDKYDRCDVDGELGPKLPVTIRNIHKRIALVVPR